MRKLMKLNSGSNGTENSLEVCYGLGWVPSERNFGIETSSRSSYPDASFRLGRQGAFPEQSAPEYGNHVEGEGNGHDPESRPCRSDSSQSTQ